MALIPDTFCDAYLEEQLAAGRLQVAAGRHESATVHASKNTVLKARQQQEAGMPNGSTALHPCEIG